MLQIPCPSCNRTIVADAHLRFPPWCVKCGADIKVNPEDVKKAAPAPPEPVVAAPSPLTMGLLPRPPRTATAPAPGLYRQPPYFHARDTAGAQRLYRVYLLQDEWLFLDRTEWRTPLPEAMFVMGGLVGALVYQFTTKGKRDAHAERLRDMDRADEFRLHVMTDEDANSFRVKTADLFDVRIDVPTRWRSWGLFGHRCVGLIAFCPGVGHSMLMELPDQQDMRRAIHELPDRLNGQIAINAVWNPDRQGFVSAANPS